MIDQSQEEKENKTNMTIMVGLPNLCRLLSESSSVGAGMGYFRGAIFWRDPVLREKENPPKKRERKPKKKKLGKKEKENPTKSWEKKKKRTHSHTRTHKKEGGRQKSRREQ